MSLENPYYIWLILAVLFAPVGTADNPEEVIGVFSAMHKGLQMLN